MKIAIVRKECGFFKGGAERYCMNLCAEMASMGHEVYVLSNKFDDSSCGGIKHVRVHVKNRSSSTKNLSFHENCQRILSEIRPDWSYALSRTYPVDAFRVSDPLHAQWMKVRYPGKLRRLLEQANPRHRVILSLEKNILNPENTRIIITNSKLVKSQVVNTYNYPASRIYVVYNGVELERFSPGEGRVREELRLDGSETVLLFVSMDFKRKGLDYLLDAIAILKSRGVGLKLVVVGKDGKKTYQKKVRKLGIGNSVFFVGEVSNVEDYYRSADIFVLPTRYDPFANVCLEAMACGTPVITTVNNGASELITESVDGYVIDEPRRIVEKLVEKLYHFVLLPASEKGKMRRQARLKAEKYSIEQNASQTLAVFEKELGLSK